MIRSNRFFVEENQPTGYDAIETRLRNDVVRVCREYIRYAKNLWIRNGHHDLEGKKAKAEFLKNSALNDKDVQVLISNINETINWLDRNEHEHTRLRQPLEAFERACIGLSVVLNNSTRYSGYR